MVAVVCRYAAALRGPPPFPRSQWRFPEPAADLVTHLLAQDPSQRPLASVLLQQRFFEAEGFPNAPALDCAALRQHTLSPPFTPRLASPFDTSHFEADEGDAWLQSAAALGPEAFALTFNGAQQCD